MPTVTVNDLNNAKLDTDTIAGVATSTALSVTDRLGNVKRTLSGMNAAMLASAAAVQGSIGYLPPVAYASGISLTLAAQTVGYSGQTYAPILSALPFTTSGTFETAKFRLIQGVSGADLAASGGAGLVGNSPTTGLTETTVQTALNGLNTRKAEKDFQTAGVGNDSGAPLQAKVNAARITGDNITLSAGTYSLNTPVNVDYTNATADSGVSPLGISLVGKSAANTVLLSNAPGFYAFKITGDANFGNLVYGPFGGFTMAPGANNPTPVGIHLYDVAFSTFKNINLQNLVIALKLESTLSSSFDRLHITGGTNGTILVKGAGFSDSNANKFTSAEFRLGTGFAVSGGPISGLWFDNLTVQGWGTQGAVGSGGMDLNFTGAEGGVGLKVDGAYIEGNKGEADFILTNNGPGVITHVFTAVNFNRILSTGFVKYNIKAIGKHRIVLIGCSFKHLNTYVPDVLRPYVSYTPGDTEVFCVGCDFSSPLEQGALKNTGTDTFAGAVNSLGNSLGLPPLWTCSRVSAGVFQVNHTLGAAAISVIAMTSTGNPHHAQRVIRGNNLFQIVITDVAGVLVDADFTFIVKVI